MIESLKFGAKATLNSSLYKRITILVIFETARIESDSWFEQFAWQSLKSSANVANISKAIV